MLYHPEVLLNMVKNKMLQKWFKSEGIQIRIFLHGKDLFAPSIEFNLFYILLHICRHFLYEDVTIRQMMDYFLMMKSMSLLDD